MIIRSIVLQDGKGEIRWPISTGGNTVLEAILLRVNDLPDIFTLGLFVLEMIDFRTIIERAVERQLVLLRASDLILEASLLLIERAAVKRPFQYSYENQSFPIQISRE